MSNIMGRIIFDFWGTLAYLEQGEDFGQGIANALNISKQEYTKIVMNHWFTRNQTAQEFARFLVASKHAAESLIPYLTGLIESPIPRARLFPDANPSLERLSADNQLYLVSDTSSIGERIIDSLKVRSYFKGVYLSNRFGQTKSNGLFERVFEEIGDASNILVVGDSVESDYLIPRKLGARSLLMDRSGKHSGFDTIKTLEEIR